MNKKEMNKRMLEFIKMTIKNPDFFKLNQKEQVKVASLYLNKNEKITKRKG